MWLVQRAGGPRARVQGTPGDSPAALAARVGLQADEADAWLVRPDDGPAGEAPNTLVFVWVGDLGRLGKRAVGWGGEMAYARSLGFHVVELDFRDGSSDSAALDRIADCSRRAELHGLVVTGHGHPGGFGTGGLTARFHPHRWAFTYDEIAAALAYRLAVVLLNACLSGYSRGDRDVRTARNPFLSRIDPDYRLSCGGRDLVAASPAARFWGHTGILYPVLQGGRLRRLLRPGDQGTVAL